MLTTDLQIHFKTKRLLFELSRISPRLRAILWELAFFCREEFGKSICITDLIRRQEEQDRIYANNPRYQEKPWKSVHQFKRGADVRTYGFAPAEIQIILKHLSNWIYDPARPDKKTAIFHDVGQGAHTHIQVSAK